MRCRSRRSPGRSGVPTCPSVSGERWRCGNYFSHDQARSRAYHWGEDGLAGFSDDKQQLCFALALWNGRDPIIKERLFGLTNSEGNHGEDIKEYYFYLDSTPTHSYMKWLYKYPQGEYPYWDLVATNRRRSHNEFEYELLDTGVFNDDRYSLHPRLTSVDPSGLCQVLSPPASEIRLAAPANPLAFTSHFYWVGSQMQLCIFSAQ